MSGASDDRGLAGEDPEVPPAPEAQVGRPTAQGGPGGNLETTFLGGVDVGSPERRQGLLFSFCEGLCTNGMLALTETFGIAAAVSLGASPMAIGLLGSLPILIGYIGLFLAPAVADPRRGRRLYTLLGVRLQAFLLFLCAFTGWLPPAWAPLIYMVLFIAAAVSAHSVGAFWVAWMGDLIPESVRGRHWAWRTAWHTTANLCASLAAGWIARAYDSRNAPWSLFFGVFLAAALFRLAASGFLARQYEPPASKPLKIFSPLRFRPRRDFVALSAATACFQGAAIMSAPFFTLWYLRDLHFNYLWLALSTCSSALGSILCVRLWGRLVDRAGTARALRAAVPLAMLNPLPHLFVSHPLAICLANFYGGATWSGYGLATFNRVLGSTENDQRHHYIAFNSIVVGLVASAFGLLGGFLSTRLPPLFGWTLRSLFLLSFAVRGLLWLIYFRGLKDAPPAAARPSA